MVQSYPIEDTEEVPITFEHVARRLSDWSKRLDVLKRDIEAWARANNWRVEAGSARMREELMERFGIEPCEFPVLSLTSPVGATVFIKPKGLWVIGANGRVDLYSPTGAFTLVDLAEPFDPPQWTLHRVGMSKGKPFTPSLIAEMV